MIINSQLIFSYKTFWHAYQGHLLVDIATILHFMIFSEICNLKNVNTFCFDVITVFKCKQSQ